MSLLQHSADLVPHGSLCLCGLGIWERRKVGRYRRERGKRNREEGERKGEVKVWCGHENIEGRRRGENESKGEKEVND